MREQRLTGVPAEVVAAMRSAISCQKPDEIQNRFGISLNTWTKLREGRAIRHSVAERLIHRLKRDQVI
jgi:hypothetical protein